MPKSVKIATIQPPIPKGQNGGNVSNEEMIDIALSMVEKAGQDSADIVCLPEIFNVFGLSVEDALQKASDKDGVLEKISVLCACYKMHAVYTSLENDGGSFYITSSLIDRSGHIAGRYRKTHITPFEKKKLNVVPGDDICVFDTDFGRIGVMICYDCYFPEVARILALGGAEIIFYPALQRYVSDSLFESQIKARALDNSVFIVRSSYGVGPETAWTPGIMIGRSCVIDRSGTIIADQGHGAGILSMDISLSLPFLMQSPGGGPPVNYAETLKNARRPELYKSICME